MCPATFLDYRSFDELILGEDIKPGHFDNILDAMEAVENMGLIRQLGDRVLYLAREGVLLPNRSEALLRDLLDAARRPMKGAARIAEIRKELKECRE